MSLAAPVRGTRHGGILPPSRVLVLYRPRLPSLRAQAIQVAHAAHAFAERGHLVTVLADRGGPGTPEEALAAFGLPSFEGLDLRLAPSEHPAVAGLWFRAEVLAWWAGAPGIVIARDKRRLRPLLSLSPRHRLVLETHELDSALAEEAGSPSQEILELERAVACRMEALVANCGGTLAAWERVHAELPARRAAVHNATSPARIRREHRPDGTVRVVGSLGSFKGPDLWVGAARELPLPLEIVGGSEADRARLGTAPNLRLARPIPYPDVPDLLAQSDALVLPLQDNFFGRELTSPLKLWDYLASPSPLVLPDLPSIHEIVDPRGVPVAWYHPARPGSLATAVREALSSGSRPPVLRSWAERAVEIEALLA